ncbi:MAG: VOC family protein [Spirochaetales bacterium]|nr:VOC family protein [Spirochaetales bacterium]
MLKGLEHVGLSVSNLERSIAFYRDLLGLKLIRVLECGEESRLDEVVGIPGCVARIAHLESEKAMLELFEYVRPRGEGIPGGRRRQADLGHIHAGFTSDDVRGEYARLKGQGVEFLSEPVEFRPGVWIVYFYGPDGEVGELRQT